MTLDGFTTLTLEMRGQGDSRCDSLPSIAEMPSHQYDQLPADIAAAYTYLVETRRIDKTRVVVVASGYACGFVERAIHEFNLAPVVVHLSPVFDADNLDLVAAISFRPPRPVLAVASDEDTYAVRSLSVFSAAVPADLLRTQRYQSAGHGVSILRDPAHFLDVDTWVVRSPPPRQFRKVALRTRSGALPNTPPLVRMLRFAPGYAAPRLHRLACRGHPGGRHPGGTPCPAFQPHRKRMEQ
jgi:hypothetical protein